jgi:NADH:ubiquinone oxidoreductase subunit 4 (subunit M)
MTEPGMTDSMAMAINGATLQMFNHGLITGGLFFPGRRHLRAGPHP